MRTLKSLTFGASACAVLILATTAASADGYQPAGLKAAAARCANFGGFYLGGNLGWAYHDHTWSDRDAWAKNATSTRLPSSVNGTEGGWTGGVQGGYNFQRGCAVFGYEADWNWTNVSQTKVNTDGQPGAALDTLSISSELNSFGTMRTRTGVVVDSVLLYVTGGLAYAHFKSAWKVQDIGVAVPTESFGVSDMRWGWAAGVGTEMSLWNNVSIKSEALYLKFEEQGSSFNSAKAVSNGNPALRRFDEQDFSVGRSRWPEFQVRLRICLLNGEAGSFEEFFAESVSPAALVRRQNHRSSIERISPLAWSRSTPSLSSRSSSLTLRQ